jgi:hypothetical protein
VSIPALLLITVDDLVDAFYSDVDQRVAQHAAAQCA